MSKAMQRKLVVLAVALSGCWRSSAPDEPAPPPPPLRPVPSHRYSTRITAAAEPDADAGATAPPVATAPPAVTRPSAALPPGCVNARIINVTIHNSDVQLVVAVGARGGVTPSWTATLQNPARTPARISLVEHAITRLVATRLNPDTISAHPLVLLCP